MKLYNVWGIGKNETLETLLLAEKSMSDINKLMLRMKKDFNNIRITEFNIHIVPDFKGAIK